MENSLYDDLSVTKVSTFLKWFNVIVQKTHPTYRNSILRLNQNTLHDAFFVLKVSTIKEWCSSLRKKKKRVRDPNNS